MTDKQVQEKMREILNSVTPTNGTQKDCAYLGKTGERFCRMTTNKSCFGCKFYDPNIYGKLNRLVEYIVKKETEHQSDIEIWKRRYQDKVLELITAKTKLEKCRTFIVEENENGECSS